MIIGVLALQGSVKEHLTALNRLKNVQAIEVKERDTLDKINGIIIPGGESTTMGKLLNDFDLLAPLKKRISDGLPVWGTCAGMVLLAKHIIDEPNVYLGVLNASVKRNAYGSQLDSFIIEKQIDEISNNPQKLVFIRAPWIQETADNVKIIATHQNKVIAVKQENILATSFHPELTNNIDWYNYFYRMCRYFN